MSKLAMVYMDDEGIEMIHMNHDELIVECWEDETENVKAIMAKCMTDAAVAILDEALTTPDIHIVDNWMEAKAA
jgi:DNA polymerase I-like protein with 3'-5' exonuclease and polymerase domains